MPSEKYLESQKSASSIPVNGMRVGIEMVTAACHIISCLSLLFAEGIPDGVSWTLLTLCITTICTIIQFQNEGEWRFSGNIFFKIPFWGIWMIITIILASYVVQPVTVIVENKVFIIFVSVLVTIRQIIQAVLIFDMFTYNKKG